MSERIKIEITEEEWRDTPEATRIRILDLMSEQGYDPGMLGDLEETIQGLTPEDIFKQFYGEEEA